MDQSTNKVNETNEKSSLSTIGILVLVFFFFFQFYREVISLVGRFDLAVAKALLTNLGGTINIVFAALGGSIGIPLIVAGLMSCFKGARKNQRRWKTVIGVSILLFFASALSMYAQSMTRAF